MRRLLVVTAASVLLLGCSDGPSGPDRKQAEFYMQGLGGRGMALRPGTDVNRIYAEASALKTNGDCAGAIPKLQQVANLGPGYENAQTALGECLLQKASTSELSAGYLEGLTWLRRAADAGWPEAQFRLAAAHALGPATIRNADEAGYWLALYDENTGKMRVGFMPPAATEVAAVEAAIPAAAKTAGATRAATWERKVWMPATPPAGTPGPTGRNVQRYGAGTGEMSQ